MKHAIRNEVLWGLTISHKKELINFLKIFLLKQADKHFSSWKVRFRDFYHKKYIFLIKITKYLRILSKNDHDYKLLANDLKFRQQIWVFLHVYLWFAMSGILKDLKHSCFYYGRVCYISCLWFLVASICLSSGLWCLLFFCVEFVLVPSKILKHN